MSWAQFSDFRVFGLFRGSALGRLMLVVAGIILGQAVLYGPSLVGRKVLLPLDILAQETAYIPRTPEIANIDVQNRVLVDLVFYSEPSRRFANAELHAGRLPMWAPYHFCGAPFIWPKFSPFLALQSCFASPLVLAWSQLLAALVAGLGAYLFFRRALTVSFWPAAICAWCYPLTGFFIFWQGFPTGWGVYWLPWILLAVDRTVRGASPWSPLGLSVTTCLVVTSGHLDVGAQVLIASGLYALWCLFDQFRSQFLQRKLWKAVSALTLAWGLGILSASPYWLPVSEYARSSVRMAGRSAGKEVRRPVGLAALPEVVLPDMYGSVEKGSFTIFPEGQGNLQESAAAAYTGMLATLLLAPLAWCSRRHRGSNLLWSCLVVFSLSWCLNVPGLMQLLRLPGLNILSHNRWVFLGIFGFLAMAAPGLEVLLQGPPRWRWWFWIPLGLVLTVFGWCLYRSVFLPDFIETQMADILLRGGQFEGIYDLAGVQRVQAWFARHYAAAAVWSGLAVAGWCWLASGTRKLLRPIFATVGVLLVADLLWFAYGRNVQSSPSLYYPPVPVLEQVAKSTPGRILGFQCLPPVLSAIVGLKDVRGYDAVDPKRMVELLSLAKDPRSITPEYAVTQWLVPQATFTAQGDIHLPPIFDLLGVRYVIFRGVPQAEARPAFQEPDYWVELNPSALPRAFVPKSIEYVPEDSTRLQKLGAAEFDPRQVAYVESRIELPGPCRGLAEIIRETPVRISLSVQMDTAGLVVLADRWDPGWHAWLDGKVVPILRTDHALRGVVVPAGTSTLEFRYQPASFTWGVRLASVAGLVLVAWAAVTVRGSKAKPLMS